MTKITQENLLINTFPEIAAQFDIERNTKSLNEVSYGSGKKVWWKCPVCHGSWEAAPYNRTLNNEGCPYCSPKHPKPHMGYCLGTEHPEVLPFWDYKRNNEEGYTPWNINPKSHKKVWWICDKNPEHHYQASVQLRSKGFGQCTECKRIKREEKERIKREREEKKKRKQEIALSK